MPVVSPSFVRAICLGVAAFSLGLGAQAVEPPKVVPGGAGKVAVQGPVQVSGAWIRATVKGQSGTGGFMQLTSSQALTLTGFASTVAASSELHEMRMDGDTMRMRAIEALPLPPKQQVTLRPGGHHLMLMGLKQALKEGDAVNLTLLLKAEDGRVIRQEVVVPVRLTAPSGAIPAAAGMHPHHDGMSHEGAMMKSQSF
jgi:copper(I)-binding protein